MSRVEAAQRPRRRWTLGGRWIPFAVVAAIAAVLVLPLRPFSRGDPELRVEPVPGRLPAAPAIPVSATRPDEARADVHTLVLYDVSGRWGWLGELYATMAGNLVSHFGSWEGKPAREYEAGEASRYTAVVYVGTTYGARLPAAFVRDVMSTSTPVVWIGSNVERLEEGGGFAARYGWRPGALDRSTVPVVRYKGTALSRWTRRTDGLRRVQIVRKSEVRVLATAVRGNGSTLPWAVRSRNLTYVTELPFTYTSETDRVLAFADMLFDVLAPETRERHRALVRLEDINPRTDPKQLRAAADYLHSQGIPFGFGVSPVYRDPQRHDDAPYELRLRNAPKLVAALRYLESKGGVLVGHGYTHQWDGGSNPYNGVTGDDVEFFRVIESGDGDVKNIGPLPADDTVAWAERRIVAANREFAAAGIELPTIFEFPHYTASLRAYRAATRRFAVRWERGVYYGGVLTGAPPRHDRSVGQFFPYVVRDAYGSKVLPENLGSIAPSTWHSYRSRQPADVVRAARANLVVRDGFASFYFHPFLDLKYLKQTVEGIRRAGYRFVSPASL